MAITWKIVNTDYTIKGAKGTNQIHQLHWTCTDAEKVGDVTHTGRIYGAIACPDPSGSFIEYAKVTEANCIAWAKALLGSDRVTEIEEAVANQITQSKTPKTGSGQPWSS